MTRTQIAMSLGLSAVLALLGGCSPAAFKLPEGKPSLELGHPLDYPRGPKDSALACLRTAESFDKNGREAEAIQGYEMARQQDKSLTHVCRRLAVLYDRQGDVPKAQVEYDRALKAFPKDSELFNDYGYFLYQQEKWAEAEKQFRIALQLSARNQRASVNLGMAIGQQGRYDEALKLFQQVLGPAESHANLGYIYATQGKREEAIRQYQQALALNDKLKPAQTALSALTGGIKTTSAEVAVGAPAEPTTPRSTAPSFSPTGVSRPRPTEAVIDRLQNFRKEREQAEVTVDDRQPDPEADVDNPERNTPAKPVITLRPPVRSESTPASR